MGRVRLGLTPVQFCKECVASQLHSRTTIASYMIRNPASCVTLINRPCTNSTHGGFHKWGHPRSWMVYKGKSHLEMDDDWGYPYFRKPLHCHIKNTPRNRQTQHKLDAISLAPLAPPPADGFLPKTERCSEPLLVPSPALRDLRLKGWSSPVYFGGKTCIFIQRTDLGQYNCKEFMRFMHFYSIETEILHHKSAGTT